VGEVAAARRREVAEGEEGACLYCLLVGVEV